MQIYLWVIFFSVLFAYIAGKCRNWKGLFFIFSTCSLLILSIFAGCRDLTVGFDVMFYEYSIFQSACYSSSFFELLNSDVSDIEPFFLFVNYTAVQVIDNIHFVLGVISFVTMLFGYMACWQYRKYVPFWLLYTIYLLLCYSTSLNIMRQYMALSIIIYSYTILKTEGLNWKFLFFCVLAVLTHYSAIFPLCVFIFYNFIPKMGKRKYNALMSLVIILAILLFPFLDMLLIKYSLLTGKDYSFYLDPSLSDADWAESTISGSKIALIILFLLLSIYGKIKKLLADLDWREYQYTIIISASCFVMASMFMGSVLRLFNYFLVLCSFNLCNVALSLFSSKYKRNKVILALLSLFIFLAFRFVYVEYSSSIFSL